MSFAGNYLEYKEASLQIFMEGSYQGMIESYGRWHDPTQAAWTSTIAPPVSPDFVFGQLQQRSRM